MEKRYSIIFSSLTGNTRKLADQIHEVLPAETCDYFGEAKGEEPSSQSSGGGAAGGDADGISGLQSGNGVQVQPEQKAVSEDLRMIIDRWKQVTGDLTPSMAVMLRGAVISEGPDNQLIIALADDMRYGYFAEESHRQALENALSERVGKLVKVNAVPLNKTENASQFIDPVQAFQGIDIVYED